MSRLARSGPWGAARPSVEALHSHEHAAEDDAEQKEFAGRRSAVISTLEGVELPDWVLSFIRKNWSKRKSDNLDRRLRALIDVLPERVRDILVPPSGDEVAAQLIEDGDVLLEGQLRRLRNNLSRGTRNYEDRALPPWVEIAETLCRARAEPTRYGCSASMTKGSSAVSRRPPLPVRLQRNRHQSLTRHDPARHPPRRTCADRSWGPAPFVPGGRRSPPETEPRLAVERARH